MPSCVVTFPFVPVGGVFAGTATFTVSVFGAASNAPAVSCTLNVKLA